VFYRRTRPRPCEEDPRCGATLLVFLDTEDPEETRPDILGGRYDARGLDKRLCSLPSCPLMRGFVCCPEGRRMAPDGPGESPRFIFVLFPSLASFGEAYRLLP
jgi:hypothetical protein